MASDSLVGQFLQLFNRFNTLLTAKFSNFLLVLANNKSAGSFGAIAGFAFAVAFVWKFFRTPNGQQGRQPKRRGSSTNGAANLVSPCSEQPSASNPEGHAASEEPEPPVKLTLGQTVRKKLNGGRKMTCQLLGAILEETRPEELQEHATVKTSAVETLREISKYCDIYLMEKILDDDSGERVLSALENAGLFSAGGLIKDKVLFCSTDNGRTSFVRQLEPDWHVDSSTEIVTQLARFIRFQLHVSPVRSAFTSPNVFSSVSLEQYFLSMD